MASQNLFQSNLDATKVLALDVDSLATATTRTITIPNKNGTLFSAADTDVTAITNLAATNVQAALAELQGDVNALVGGMVFRGLFDPASSFPTDATTAGSMYRVGWAGTRDGIAFNVGDSLYSLIANPSSTVYAGNWAIIDSSDAVSTVFARSGAIVATAGDYTATQITNTPAGNIAAVTVQAAITELDNEKLSTVLTSGQIRVGNVSNVATGVALTGDVTITNAGVTTVVSASATVLGKVELATPAEVLTGTDTVRATTAQGVNGYFTALVGNASGVQHLGTFTGTTIADNVAVKAALQSLETAVELTATSSLASATIFVGNVSNVAQSRALTGDVSIDNLGATTVVAASTTAAGKVELATPAEVLAVTSNTVAATPLSLAGLIMEAVAKSTYTATNVTTDRSFDANSFTVQELADVLGTLIADLRTKGIVA